MSIFSKVKAKLNTTKLKVRTAAVGFTLAIASVAAIATINNAAASPSSTPDCDSNAAVWCGVSQVGSLTNEIAQVKKVYANGDGHNKYYTIQDMYNYFGMSTSVINGLSTSNVVSGYVSGNSEGDIYATINGQNTLVATGATTAGRENISGSTTVKYGATTFYVRPTHVSFENGELAALIIMKNGVFQNAILTSCGNPVKGTPKKPNYSITKQVATSANGTYGSNVSVKSGSAVYYKIAVKSTGAIPVQDVAVHDTLPSGISYTSGTLQENGKAVSSSDASKFFSSTGLNVGTIKNGATDTFTFAAKAGTVAFDDTSCKPGDFTNNGYVAAPGLSTLNGSAKVSTTCAPSASLACVGLTAVADTADATSGNQKYTFTARSNAQNVTISAYNFNFGDKNTATVTSNAASVTATHTYAPGNYTASFAVTGKASATSKSYTSSSCTYSVTVNQPPKPAYKIVKQVATSANGMYSSNVSVKSGATVYYKITVSSTGDAPVTNVTVKDTLPSDIKYASGTLNQDGTAVSAANASLFFGNGLNVASIKNGSSTVFTYSAVAGNTATDTDPSCKAETLDNTGSISTPGLSNEQSSAEVDTTCTQLPGTLACVALQAIAGDVDSATGNQSYTFGATATANDATVKTYSFTVTDATGKTVATLPGTLSNNGLSATSAAQSFAPGTYAVNVTVTGVDNYNKPVQAPVSGGCSKSFTIAQQCKPGVQAGSNECYAYTCNLFTIGIDNASRKVTVTGFKATSTNPNATATQVTVVWGDGATGQVAYADATTLSHTFTADSSTVTATAQFTTPDGTTPVSSTTCSQPVSFTAPTPPPTLPNTGAGDTIGIFAGVVAAATIGFRVYTIRKLSRR